MKENIPQTDENIGGGKKGRWAIVSIVIAALSIWAVTSQWKGFSLGHFIDYVSRAKPGWLACAIVAMLGFVPTLLECLGVVVPEPMNEILEYIDLAGEILLGFFALVFLLRARDRYR